MKKFWQLSPRAVTTLLLGWLLFSMGLATINHSIEWWPTKIALFLCLAFLPGTALLRLLRIHPKNTITKLIYCFGLSILALMLSGLLVNTLLPFTGVARPLQFWWVLCGWGYVTAALIIAAAVFNRTAVYIQQVAIGLPKKVYWPSLLLSMVLPWLAAAGAFRLNNGGDGVVALATLGITTLFIMSLFVLRRRFSDKLLAWCIFSISLTILLMTALRGWDIVGHDIEREFAVYTLTNMHGVWNIAFNRAPYNACLSITILPEMFTQLLGVSGLFVFKVILQIIFAVCPVVIFVLLRKYTPKLGALTGCLLFICYPTFINDSVMLTRQGVAYLFFALALLILANKTQDMRHKVLFLLCALGAILSHYSTAYMFVGLFIIAVICKLAVLAWGRIKKHPIPGITRKTVLSPLFALLLFGLTFTWYSQITGTSSGLAVTLQKSFENIPKIFSSDNRSTDTSTALLFASSKTQADLYELYLEKTLPQKQADEVEGRNYFPALTGDDLPLTALGEQVKKIGFDPIVIAVLRQHFAKVLQVLALVGVIYVSYRLLRRKRHIVDADFTFLSIAGILVLALLVILPVLSINYGILRAFQQTLIFLILPITLLLADCVRRINRRVISTAATTGIALLFLLFTGVLAQLLGGVSPSLSMNNQGLYYGLYYTSDIDKQGFTWLKQHVNKKEDVRAANFNRIHMHDPNYPFNRSGILPSQITNSSYIYLDPAQVNLKKVYAYYDSSPFIMTLPTGFYDNAKNQLYSTGSTRIYQ